MVGEVASGHVTRSCQRVDPAPFAALMPNLTFALQQLPHPVGPGDIELLVEHRGKSDVDSKQGLVGRKCKARRCRKGHGLSWA